MTEAGVATEIVIDTVHDARGRKTEVTAPYYLGATVYKTKTAYDAADRVVSVTEPDGAVTTTTYAAAPAGYFSQVITKAPLARETRVLNDAHGNVRRTARMLGATEIKTEVEFDALDRVTEITDPGGSVWTNTYDMLGRRTQAKDPDLGTWTYAYNAAGRLVAQTDALGATTDLTYARFGRVTRKVVTPSGQPGRSTYSFYGEAVTGGFNKGKLTRQYTADARVCFDYNAVGDKIRERWTFPGVSAACPSVIDEDELVTEIYYDKGGRVVGKKYPSGEVSGSSDPEKTGDAGAWRYDLAGRLLSIPKLIDAFAYNASGQVTKATYENGVITANAFSPQRNWLTTYETKVGATVLLKGVYTRDAAGRITGVTTSGTTKDSWAYGYDALDRLISANNANDNTLDQTFAYLANGNFSSMTTNGVASAYVYPAATAPRPHAPTSVGGQALTYDANGNMKSGRGRTFTWDGENRPSSIQMGTAAPVTFVYGPEGGRVKKLAPTPASQNCPATARIETLTIGDVQRVIKPVCAGGVKTGETAEWTNNVHADAKTVKSGTDAAKPMFLHRDHLSTVRLVTRDAGAVEERSSFKPYGDRARTPGTGATTVETKGFIGERDDPETGLVYLNARYYDPAIGRFVSPDTYDPLGEGVGTNRYAYADNDPINKSDPNGHIFQLLAALAAAVPVAGSAAPPIMTVGLTAAAETGVTVTITEGIRTAAVTGAGGGSGLWYGSGVATGVKAAATAGVTTGVVAGTSSGVAASVSGSFQVAQSTILTPRISPSPGLLPRVGVPPSTLGARMPWLPRGMTNKQFGEQIMNWGKGSESGKWLQRLQNDPGFAKQIAESAKNNGVTKEAIGRTSDMYKENFGRNPQQQFKNRGDGLDIIKNLYSEGGTYFCPDGLCS
ncbi:RHS repeat-associated core domain-containing protein [Methylopila sp. M107]|uniref:RHS repeat-associated core domain-containing protein n=1 Tax=Methylopila sp. M107 TaxID=1101190 RepID=UPI000367EAD9|nr:RHS repeat-associated core domain-containing protein [Methylopila sp. M107]